jgi:hypothetical protein
MPFFNTGLRIYLVSLRTPAVEDSFAPQCILQWCNRFQAPKANTMPEGASFLYMIQKQPVWYRADDLFPHHPVRNAHFTIPPDARISIPVKLSRPQPMPVFIINTA